MKNVSQNSSNPAKAEVPQSVQKPKDVVKTIAVSSADAERNYVQRQQNVIKSN